MKVWEAVAMLNQIDPQLECMVTFGQANKQKPLEGVPYKQDYYVPKWPGAFVNIKTSNSYLVQ